MDFRWNGWNIAKVMGHGVTPGEAEHVVTGASDPFPTRREDDKYLVWGSTESGRLLQVVFIVDDGDEIFVIHARPLKNRERWQYRRLRRKRGKS